MISIESIENSNTKVAFHPEPKGVIQFIGGFISGSFPEVSFRYLLQDLYEKRYSIVVYHFPFNQFQFNHWSVAIDILEDLYKVRFQIIKQLFCSRATDQILDFYARDTNYFWLGYSLGCKYIVLLEILSNDRSQFQRRSNILSSCLREEVLTQIEQDIERADKSRKLAENNISNLLRSKYQISPFIRDKPSLLLAPEINNTVEIFNKLITLFAFWDSPNKEQIQCLIKQSTDLFNLMGLISFKEDNIAADDVDFLDAQLKKRTILPFLHQTLDGTHDKPLESDIDDLVFYIDSLLLQLQQRQSKGKFI